MPHSANSALCYGHMSTSQIKLTLMMGAWGKRGDRPGKPLTAAERKALAAEYRTRQIQQAEGWLAKARAADDTEWIATVEAVLDRLRQKRPLMR